MSRKNKILMGVAATAALAAAFSFAQARPLIEKNISQEGVLLGYKTMLTGCTAGANGVTMVVVDRAGLVAFQARPDGASPHNLDLAYRKAYTGRTFRSPSIAWRDRTVDGMQAAGQRMLVNTIPLGGGYPIMLDNEAVGGVGVSGAMGGQQGDNDCAKLIAEAIANDMR